MVLILTEDSAELQFELAFLSHSSTAHGDLFAFVELLI